MAEFAAPPLRAATLVAAGLAAGFAAASVRWAAVLAILALSAMLAALAQQTLP